MDEAIHLSSESSEGGAERARSLYEWQVQDSKLIKDLQFEDFMEGIRFVNEVATVAEAQNHDPDLEVRWEREGVDLTNHSAGELTEERLPAGRRIDQL
jgi:4a-hydroxytetrahydrobiopterin dehydratase